MTIIAFRKYLFISLDNALNHGDEKYQADMQRGWLDTLAPLRKIPESCALSYVAAHLMEMLHMVTCRGIRVMHFIMHHKVCRIYDILA